MRCPACDGDMRPHRLGDAAAARCTCCDALWIEAADVTRWILTRCPSALTAPDSRLRGVTAIATGSCPSCAGPMHLGVLHGLSFDQCDTCRGVFLSRSVAELIGERARGRPSPPSVPDGASSPLGIEAVLELLTGSYRPW